jgi:hypothetical protein
MAEAHSDDSRLTEKLAPGRRSLAPEWCVGDHILLGMKSLNSLPRARHPVSRSSLLNLPRPARGFLLDGGRSLAPRCCPAGSEPSPVISVYPARRPIRRANVAAKWGMNRRTAATNAVGDHVVVRRRNVADARVTPCSRCRGARAENNCNGKEESNATAHVVKCGAWQSGVQARWQSTCSSMSTTRSVMASSAGSAPAAAFELRGDIGALRG